ncbi:hypothetical protein PUNSTDRAFT_141075 [Punctularia strigosozonata HHB-11173 SS5]|uniref:uncharacterized protein n=1 Tax=Punctularia strigosozonata (strain HHB-11173) TaxID=741275 RepID=UPI0004416654|nr:uncharacterized protein PUNSTDRAFT_141075 [Punctularia strigosozonata HHB-11173 SS5]EIN12334.1 hypothetical protein PUNSTDRAFT_141075 [Punctularia strigosozonata HHB-11173 SS5]
MSPENNLIPNPLCDTYEIDGVVKRRRLKDTLDELDGNLPDAWHVITYDMRRAMQRHLDPKKCMNLQDKTAVDLCTKEICDQYPYFRRFEDAWPVLRYMEQYMHATLKDRLPDGSPRGWKKMRMLRAHWHRQAQGRARASLSKSAVRVLKQPTVFEPQVKADLIDANEDADGEAGNGTPRRSSRIARAKSDECKQSPIARLEVDNDVEMHSIRGPSTISRDRAQVRPFVGKLRKPSLGCRPGDPQPSLSDANPVEAFLRNLDVPMDHLFAVFHSLGIRQQAELDGLVSWDVDERNSWLDEQLHPRLERGEITPFEVQVVKRALTARRVYLAASAKENRA